MTSPTSPIFVRFVAIILAILVAAPSARADEAAARQHFRHGVELYDRKQYAAALESFLAAYAEKPSAGIKQNIGLCLKGLGRPIEAASAFDEALDEGEATLKPEVRAAMEQELAELSKVVATVRLAVVDVADRRPRGDVVVTVDGTALTSAALRRPVRLEPGIHVFTAHADGLADPPEKRLSILAGSPVDATFELGSAAADVVVSPGASVEVPMTLPPRAELPPVYTLPVRRPRPEKEKRYLVPMLAYEAESLRLAEVLGEQAGGTRRAFTGGSFGVRAGYRTSRMLSLEILGNVGQVTGSYAITAAAAESNTKVTHWQLTPGVRFATTGPVRFTLGTGVGVQGLVVNADIHTSLTGPAMAGTQATHKGSGVGASWLFDMGMQFDVGSFFLEVVGFVDTHGVGTTRDDGTNDRMFLSSPSTRAGIRVGLGIPF